MEELVLATFLFLLMGAAVLIVCCRKSKAREAARERVERLEQENKRLNEILEESYESSKLLVGKDRELTAANHELQERTRELDEITRILVRRDLKLNKANEILQRLDKVKSEFVSVAAHQLRTPLTSIKWSLHALNTEWQKNLNEEQKESIGEAFESSQRLIRLINDLLDVARLEEGRLGFHYQKQSLVPLLLHIYERFSSNARKRKIDFQLELPKTLTQISFDAGKIDVVLENLVDNALKYTPMGGRVTMRARAANDNILVEVEDTGIGVPEAEQHGVFQKFFRAANAQLAQTSGTGLGLYLSSRIVAQHGGEMRLRSNKGKGTTFFFTLPRGKASKEDKEKDSVEETEGTI
ncbi:HAMP domain-containing histidine kinase [Patescibacteria group bacterium]|nr:HAMP domain-containing histidine kinase [Patescibacteria group bacterium]